MAPVRHPHHLTEDPDRNGFQSRLRAPLTCQLGHDEAAYQAVEAVAEAVGEPRRVPQVPRAQLVLHLRLEGRDVDDRSDHRQ